MDNIPPPLLPFNNQNNNIISPDPSHTIQDMVPAPSNPVLPPSNPTSRDANVAKRYRAAPAKTFQCRGYGDCHMVFSRSEHLARHIRKHTGERPFTCHCGKQFSRLDNLRQHAQTVHSDKQEENERMMRELTALHTSMTAAHKAANARGKRAQQQHQHQQQQHASASSAAAVTTSAAASTTAAGSMGNPAQLGMGVGMNNGVKVEELQMHRSLSQSANNYGLGSSILQQTLLRPPLTTTMDLDHTLHRSSYSYSPDSSSTSSSACQQFPPTPPITPPTAIPFVTPTSPFGVQPSPQQLQQQPVRSTSTGSNTSSNHSNRHNNNMAPPTSPFYPPPSPFSPPPQSSHPGAHHHLAVGHQLQAVPTQRHYQHQQGQQQLLVQLSRPSIPLSPNPSPHPAGSLTFSNYPPAQQGPAPHGDREPHQPPTHISPTGLLSGAVPDDSRRQLQLQAALVEGWNLSQSFPYTDPQQNWEDQVSQHQQARRMSSSPAAASESMLTPHMTTTHRVRPTGMARAQTTAPFPSTHPRSPTPGHQQQQQQQGHLGFGNGRTTGPSPTMTGDPTTGAIGGVAATTTGARTQGLMSSHQGAAPERRLGPHPPPPPPPGNGPPAGSSNSTTGVEADLSLDGSPSWNSAMMTTPTTTSLQGGIFYPYPLAQGQDPPPHLGGSSSLRQAQQPHSQSRTQQQLYLSRQSHNQQQRRQSQREDELARQVQAGLQVRAAPSHMGSIAPHLEGLEGGYIQQYVAMAQAQAQAQVQAHVALHQQHQQQAYYQLDPNSNSNGLPQRYHRTDGEVPPPSHHQVQGHPPTPTSAVTPGTVYNSPPLLAQGQVQGTIKYEQSPSLHAGGLQHLQE